MKGVDTALRATTLHKPHVATHAREVSVETNVLGNADPARGRAFGERLRRRAETAAALTL
jgi:hypothetical protein